MEMIKHAKLFFDGRAIIFFIFKLSITHHNNSHGNENTLRPQNFLKTHGINVIKINSFQWKQLKTLNYAKMWQKKICCPKIINKRLQHVIDYENNNNYRLKQKFSEKVRQESVEVI